VTSYRIITAYLNDQVVIYRGQYVDGSTALVLRDADTGELVAKATVCMEAYGEKPRDNQHVFIKDYSENVGLLKALQHAAIVGPILRTLDADHATGGVHEVRLAESAAVVDL
jgi:hypothetical protein